MAHYGTLQDFQFSDQADDVRGAALYGSDDKKLGKIDDVIFDHQSGSIQYAVVDTGGWLSSRQFLVPASRITARGDKDDEYRVDLTREQIERFPAYDEKNLKDEKKWKQYQESYHKASGFEDDGVLHQSGSTRIITPEPSQVSPNAPHLGRDEAPVAGLEPHHLPRQSAGPMNTSPTAWGQSPDNTRLQETGVGLPRSGETVVETTGSSGIELDTERKLQSQPDNALATDNLHTMEGDSILNEEDIHHLHGDRNADLGSRIEGGSAVGSGSYLGSRVGHRWSRFENRLKEERARLTGNCSVCDDLRNRHREDAA